MGLLRYSAGRTLVFTVPIRNHIDSVTGSPSRGQPENLYYVTVLSNLVRGYDKYARVYDKSKIPESTFPNKFFLVFKHEIHIGIGKASSLLCKTGLPGDRLIALETSVCVDELHPNLPTGRGRFVERSHVAVEAVYLVDESGALTGIRIEEASALSLRLHVQDNEHYEQLV